MSRTAWLLALALVSGACRSHEAPAGSSGSGSGSGSTETKARPLVVSPACSAAIQQGPATPLDARVKLLLDACTVCGDWAPILDWRRPQPEGGPTRAAIEAAMLGCSAYCDPSAKQRFLGTLDDARGANSRAPWRGLGEMCKEKVSAVPDARFASATLFALDRIARAVAAHGGAEAAALVQLDVPVPALSISGVGIDLPHADGAEPTAPRMHVTVTANEVRIGKLPVAHLGPAGVVVDYGGEPYPGALAADPAAALAGVDVVVVIAPAKLPASRVAEVVTQLRARRVLLAVAFDAPDAWQLVGTLPISLRDPSRAAGAVQKVPLMGPAAPYTADPGGRPVTVLAGGDATVSDLAELLTRLAAAGVKQIALHTGRDSGQ